MTGGLVVLVSFPSDCACRVSIYSLDHLSSLWIAFMIGSGVSMLLLSWEERLEESVRFTASACGPFSQKLFFLLVGI